MSELMVAAGLTGYILGAVTTLLVVYVANKLWR